MKEKIVELVLGVILVVIEVLPYSREIVCI